jgi:hypothetical protein
LPDFKRDMRHRDEVGVNFENVLRKNAPTQLRVELLELVALAHESVLRDELAVTPRRPRSLWLIQPTLRRIPVPLEVPGSTHPSANTSVPKTLSRGTKVLSRGLRHAAKIQWSQEINDLSRGTASHCDTAGPGSGTAGTEGDAALLGAIITERPNGVWASDHTMTATLEEGEVTVLAAVGRRMTEFVDLHTAAKPTRFKALEPLRRAVRDYCGDFGTGAAARIRNGSDQDLQHMSDDYQTEIAFLSVESSTSFVRQPKCNGCVERFIRMLKKQLLWVRTFENVEKLQGAQAEFRKRYNQRLIVQHLSCLTPAQTRQQLVALGTAA